MNKMKARSAVFRLWSDVPKVGTIASFYSLSLIHFFIETFRRLESSPNGRKEKEKIHDHPQVTHSRESLKISLITFSTK